MTATSSGHVELARCAYCHSDFRANSSWEEHPLNMVMMMPLVMTEMAITMARIATRTFAQARAWENLP